MTGFIKMGLEKYISTKFQVQPASTSSKNYYLGNSSHPQKGSVNQVNFLVPKDHGFAPVLQRLTNQVKNYKWHNYKSKL